MFTHKIIDSYYDDTGLVSTVTGIYTGQTEAAFDGVVPASTTGFAINLAFAFATIQALLISSSQAVTMKTNSDTSPAQTIPLTAGQQINWGVGFSTPNPITANVTAVYVDNAGTTPATFKLRVLSP